MFWQIHPLRTDAPAKNLQQFSNTIELLRLINKSATEQIYNEFTQ